MAKKQVIDPLSCAALLISPHFGERALSIGTAFVMREENTDFLVTNWHNVTGRNPHTGAHLSANAAEPDSIFVRLHSKAKLGYWIEQKIPLFAADGEPLWYEHPDHRSRVDVVALQLPSNPAAMTYPINEIIKGNKMKVEIGHDLFIIGFPFGFNTGGLPVWKKASIATEPEVDVDGLPKFLADTASRPGMSGSPVIRRTFGQYQAEDGGSVLHTGSATKFLGTYSGRIGAEDELKAQLGIVWRASLISDILAAKMPGRRIPA